MSVAGRTVRVAWAPWLALLARLGVAGVWAFAALAKLGDPDAAVRAVRAYQILPESLVKPFAWGLPFVELALAVLLVVGLGTRAAAWCSALILVVFMIGIASAWARGLQIDCGCFGGGGVAKTDGGKYAAELGRDAVFLGLACFVALGPSAPFALDERMAE